MKKFISIIAIMLLICCSFACTGRQINSIASISQSSVTSQESVVSSSQEDSSISVEPSISSVISSSSIAPSISSEESSSSVTPSISSVISSSSVTPSISSSSIVSSSSKIEYLVTINQATGGTISASVSKGYYGTSVIFSCEVATGYKIDYYTVDGQRIDGNSVELTKNIQVSAVFSKVAYDIIINNAEGGIVTASVSKATFGTTVTLTVTCNEHYVLKSLKVNGTDITSAKSFAMPTGNATITVEYSYTAHWSPEA